MVERVDWTAPNWSEGKGLGCRKADQVFSRVLSNLNNHDKSIF